MYLWPQKFNMYIIGGVVLTAVLRIRIPSTGSTCVWASWIRIRIWILLTLSKNVLWLLFTEFCVITMLRHRNFELTSIATSWLWNYDYRNIDIMKLRLSRHHKFELLCTFRDIVITRNKPRTVATLAWTARRSNHLARSLHMARSPSLARSHPQG